ncbi:MAG: antibiotic biosynthesis monooxygenase family protein [Steroidobacteraceae bacterium]
MAAGGHASNQEKGKKMPMPMREELSQSVSFAQQLERAGPGPIVLINTFTVHPGDAAAMLATWQQDSQVMKAQPGFIAAQLHAGVADSGVFLNRAVWESVEHFRAAHANPAFRAAIAQTPAGAIARPHLFRTIAVPGICIA